MWFPPFPAANDGLGAKLSSAENLGPRRGERRVRVRQSGGNAERGEARDAVLTDAARHDTVEMRQLGRDVQGDPMPADPAAHAHADGGDLRLAAHAIGDPYADA